MHASPVCKYGMKMVFSQFSSSLFQREMQKLPFPMRMGSWLEHHKGAYRQEGK